MHYALPPRKSSRPHPYAAARQSQAPWLRKGRLRTLAVVAVVILLLVLAWSRFHRIQRRPKEQIPAGTPYVVLVTSFDPASRGQYEHTIMENRRAYADSHGYATFFSNQTDYDLSNPSTTSPPSWSKVPTMRHAMARFPHSTWFFYLDEHALIMQPDLDIVTHITTPDRLSTLLIPNKPVVPPDSVIHTSSHPSPSHIDALFAQDHIGISPTAFLLRRGEWAHFFLDAWFDPLYRSYNFQRAEGHALEHLVQWHGTVLARFGLVSQRIFNSYAKGEGEEAYSDGDFVASWVGCDRAGSGRSCEEEAKPFLEKVAVLQDLQGQGRNG